MGTRGEDKKGEGRFMSLREKQQNERKEVNGSERGVNWPRCWG